MLVNNHNIEAKLFSLIDLAGGLMLNMEFLEMEPIIMAGTPYIQYEEDQLFQQQPAEQQEEYELLQQLHLGEQDEYELLQQLHLGEQEEGQIMQQPQTDEQQEDELVQQQQLGEQQEEGQLVQPQLDEQQDEGQLIQQVVGEEEGKGYLTQLQFGEQEEQWRISLPEDFYLKPMETLLYMNLEDGTEELLLIRTEELKDTKLHNYFFERKAVNVIIVKSNNQDQGEEKEILVVNPNLKANMAPSFYLGDVKVINMDMYEGMQTIMVGPEDIQQEEFQWGEQLQLGVQSEELYQINVPENLQLNPMETLLFITLEDGTDEYIIVSTEKVYSFDLQNYLLERKAVNVVVVQSN